MQKNRRSRLKSKAQTFHPTQQNDKKSSGGSKGPEQTNTLSKGEEKKWQQPAQYDHPRPSWEQAIDLEKLCSTQEEETATLRSALCAEPRWEKESKSEQKSAKELMSSLSMLDVLYLLPYTDAADVESASPIDTLMWERALKRLFILDEVLFP